MRPNIYLQRHGWAYSNRIVVRCSAKEAQGIKDNLNNHVLPTVTQFYRSQAEAIRQQQEEANKHQDEIFGGVEAAIRNQR